MDLFQRQFKNQELIGKWCSQSPRVTKGRGMPTLNYNLSLAGTIDTVYYLFFKVYYLSVIWKIGA